MLLSDSRMSDQTSPTNATEHRSGLVRSAAVFLGIVLAVLVLYIYRESYWRPYTDAAQESMASFHAHAFAIANFAGLTSNPFVAKNFDLSAGRVVVYNHWPNGFFLTFATFIKMFGNTEMIGRTFALLWTVTGAFLFARAFRDRYGLAYLMVPVLLLTPLAKGAMSLVFLDSSLFFWIGVITATATLSEERHRHASVLFRVTVFVAPLFCQLIIPFAFFAALARLLVLRQRRTFLIDLTCLSISSAFILTALCWVPAGLATGAKELWLQFLHRSNIHLRYSEDASFRFLAHELRWHLIGNLGKPVTVLLPFSWIYLAFKKRSVAVWMPAVVVYSFLLRNFVALHPFTNLPLLAIGLFTTFLGTSLLVVDLMDRWKVGGSQQEFSRCRSLSPPLCIAAGLVLLILMSGSKRTYYGVPEPRVAEERALYRRIALTIDESPCGAFHTIDPIFPDEMERIGQYYCGRRIVRALQTREPHRLCMISLHAGTVVSGK